MIRKLVVPVELETDKAIVLVTSKQGGFLRTRFAEDGGWLKVGELAALVSDEAGEPLPAERSAVAEGMMAAFETT